MSNRIARRPVTADPFAALAGLPGLDATFDELIRRAFGGSTSGTRQRTGFVPAVDMEVVDRDVVVRLELPGIDPERDVSIEIDRGRLVVSGQRTEHEQGEHSGVLVREQRYGSFRREFALPEGTSPEAVSATYDAGILSVTVAGVVRPEPQPVKVPVAVRGAAPQQQVEAPATIEHDQDGEGQQA